MRKIIVLHLAIISLLFFCACQKEIHFPSGTSPVQDSTIAPVPDTPVAGKSDSYLPLTKNTFWKYKDSTTGGTITLTVPGIKTTIRNKPYEQVQESLYESPALYSVAGADYYVYHNLAGVPIEVLFLNDAAKVGDSWTIDMGILIDKKATGIGTIVAKGLKIKVEGKIYQDVIHSTYRIYYQLNGATYSYGGYEFYTAKGIGIVKMESRFGIDGVQTLYTDLKTLVDFSIK